MSKKDGYGIGIVGCGMIADFHARAIAAMRGGHLACVFSRSKTNADRVADEYNCASYQDYQAFLAHPGLDIVAIATPSGAHLEPCVKAAAAGKHVICEKPLEVTLERVDRMIHACESNEVMLAGIFPRRFSEATAVFKKAVGAGRLGKITLADAYIKWYRTQEYYDSGDWRGTWLLDGGGALMNQSIHTIDLLYHLAGEVDSVCAYADRAIHRDIETEDNAVAIVRFKSGALGVIEGSTSCYSPTGHPAEVHLCGSDGSIFMRDNSFPVWDFKKKWPSDTKTRQIFRAELGEAGAGAADPSAIDFSGHQKCFEDTVRAIKTGKKPFIDGNEARKSIEIILAIYRSALKGGKPVQLPLKRTPVRKSFK
ncbi:oxidoreductase [Alkalispirochaeta odontotermitis]|nr:oxidoreductase [Alkalispirochaeta odontotermitis]CAB1078106.1 Myo-inositol 2-dehydrogenase (EC [Olavius algarvensis Delta 1 endosymbiont]